MCRNTQDTSKIGQGSLIAACTGLNGDAVTPACGTYCEAIAKLLNDSLAIGLACELPCNHRHFRSTGLSFLTIADEFLVHASKKLTHADRATERVAPLGNAPDFTPAALPACTRAGRIKHTKSNDQKTMIRGNLVAERIAAKTHRPMIELVGEQYTTTHRMPCSSVRGSKKHNATFAGGQPVNRRSAAGGLVFRTPH